MDALIRNSRVNLLLTFQQTGIKLKLLHALESGQHILINSLMDDAGIFTNLCHVEDEPQAIAHKIDELMEIPFTENDKQVRDLKFEEYYGNQRNARRILALIDSDQPVN